jgi:hypothetical protein
MNAITFPGSTIKRDALLGALRTQDAQLKTGRLGSFPWHDVYPNAVTPTLNFGPRVDKYDPTNEHHTFMRHIKCQPDITLGEMAHQAVSVREAASAKADRLRYALEHSALRTLTVAAGVIGSVFCGFAIAMGAGPACGLGLLFSAGTGLVAYYSPQIVSEHYGDKAAAASTFNQTVQRWGAVLSNNEAAPTNADAA